MVVVSSDRSRTPRRRAQLESSLRASKPSGFKRSSERKVGELQLRQWAFSDAWEEDRRLESFEEIGVSAGAASVLVEPLSGNERLEALTDRMLAEDLSRFDVDGGVR